MHTWQDLSLLFILSKFLPTLIDFTHIYTSAQNKSTQKKPLQDEGRKQPTLKILLIETWEGRCHQKKKKCRLDAKSCSNTVLSVLRHSYNIK